MRCHAKAAPLGWGAHPSDRRSARAASPVLTALLALLALLALAPSALADVSIGSPGSGAGQYLEPRGLAVDGSSGNLYVADATNNRVDVFSSTGAFIRAFGWGVADGTSPELQSCTATCFKGIRGDGAGQINSNLRVVAVDNDPTSPAYHDVYVGGGPRVQRFSPAGAFLGAWGGGVVTGGAAGNGDLASGSATVTAVKTTAKSFEPGQTITGAGIPADTKILALGEGTITLSKAATASGTAVPLSVAAGAGNVPTDEQQSIAIEDSPSGGTFTLTFTTPNPSSTSATTGPLARNAPATGLGSVQNALQNLANVGAGNVAVTGPAGGPWTVTFQGARFADTDVAQLSATSALTPSGRVGVTTTREGAGAAEICSAAAAVSCVGGVGGSGEGQFAANNVKLATGPDGLVYVGDGTLRRFENEDVFILRIQKFEPSGTFVEQFSLPESPGAMSALAVDSIGNSYIGRSGSTGAVRKYDPAGSCLNCLNPIDPSFNITALALDSADNLFVADNSEASAVYQYDSAGNQLRSFGYGALASRAEGIAPYPAGGICTTQGFEGTSKVTCIDFPPPGPIVLPQPAIGFGSPRTFASAVTNIKATLNATVNPEGEATTVHFQYVDDEGFKASGFAGPSVKTTPESASIGSDFKLHVSSAAITGLTPETVYHFRAVATNPSGADTGPTAQFETLPPVDFRATWSTEVGIDAAILHAELNPQGIATSGYFQYVDDATYQASGFAEASAAPDVPGGAGPLDFGAGEAPKALAAQLYDLQADTTYHYRIAAVSSFGTVFGPERVLSTLGPIPAPSVCPSNQAFRTGTGAALPDCRAYEMVSPVEKGNGDIAVQVNLVNNPASLNQSAVSGDALTYSTYRPFANPQGAPYSSQYIASRASGGWSNRAISPPQQGSTDTVATKDVQFKAFLPDLSAAWILYASDVALEPGVPAGFLNIYRRDNAAGAYQALIRTDPAAKEFGPELQGISADGSHAAFRAKAPLTPDAATKKGVYQTYLAFDDELRLVSVLPNGVASKVDSSVGTPGGRELYGRESSVAGAVSADGSRVYWSESKVIFTPGKVYLRENAEQEQSAIAAGQCTEAEKACTVPVSSGGAVFLAGSPDGSKAIFREGSQLFEYDAESKATALIGSSLGILGTSTDLSRLYFVSIDALAGAAKAGQPNLYLRAGGTNDFIATLSQADAAAQLSNTTPVPINHVARVTPDGRHVAFMSTASLSGYDNTDANSGEADAEVYRYAADSGQLSCVSCNPTGARPVGRDIAGEANLLLPFWAAAQIPGWENQIYGSRPLSEDGKRLFFESFEALVAADTNGVKDVYEWEAPGAGDCEASGPSFVESSGGCLDLISSGESPQDSEFVDAGPDGRDVFFTTGQSLVAQDTGLIDIYDARAGGGFTAPPPALSECQGEACQSPAQPPGFPTPSSTSFRGPGDPPARQKAKKHKKKQVKKKSKQRAKKKKQANKHRQSKQNRHEGAGR